MAGWLWLFRFLRDRTASPVKPLPKSSRAGGSSTWLIEKSMRPVRPPSTIGEYTSSPETWSRRQNRWRN
jgi:hypothetical protein